MRLLCGAQTRAETDQQPGPVSAIVGDEFHGVRSPFARGGIAGPLASGDVQGKGVKPSRLSEHVLWFRATTQGREAGRAKEVGSRPKSDPFCLVTLNLFQGPWPTLSLGAAQGERSGHGC